MKTHLLALLVLILIFSCAKDKDTPDYITAEVNGIPWKASEWQAAPEPGGGISILAGRAADSSMITLNLSTMRTPGTYTFRIGQVMPAVLIEFRVQEIQGGAEIQWTTANSSGLQRIELERSTDALSFIAITSVDAVNTAGQHTYTFLDPDTNILPFYYYYRLRFIETDGSYYYSPVQRYTPSYTAFFYDGDNAYKGINGEVIIESVDSTQQRMAGRFAFDYRVSPTELRKIRNGRFAISY